MLIQPLVTGSIKFGAQISSKPSQNRFVVRRKLDRQYLIWKRGSSLGIGSIIVLDSLNDHLVIEVLLSGRIHTSGSEYS